MALHVEWTDEELPQLQQLLTRALNTWNPKDAPKWAWELNARVQARITDLKLKAEEKANGSGNDGS
jgi:hypothetical protein